MKKKEFHYGKIVNNLLSCFNLEISRKSKDTNNRWDALSRLPDVPTIIDIGIGPKGTPELYKRFPNSSYVFIDPHEEFSIAVKDFLGKNNNIYITTALGAVNATTKLHIGYDLSVSNVATQIENVCDKYKTIEERIVPLRILDDVIAELPLKKPIGIKIDTEGFEMEVLKGASKTLTDSLFIIVEFHYRPKIFINNTVNTFYYNLQDLINYMINAGFSADYMIPDGQNIIFIKS